MEKKKKLVLKRQAILELSSSKLHEAQGGVITWITTEETTVRIPTVTG